MSCIKVGLQLDLRVLQKVEVSQRGMSLALRHDAYGGKVGTYEKRMATIDSIL